MTEDGPTSASEEARPNPDDASADAGAGETADDLRPFVEHVLKVFGPERVMWGSDWPVCRLQAEYDDWFTLAQGFTAQFSDPERAAIFGGNAARFYGLS